MRELIEMARLTISLPKDMHTKLKTIAAERNTTMTNFVLYLLHGAIQQIDEINGESKKD